MLNREKFEYCRIPAWHEAGYTGQGVKVAVFEDTAQGHGRMVADVLQQILPDAENEEDVYKRQISLRQCKIGRHISFKIRLSAGTAYNLGTNN